MDDQARLLAKIGQSMLISLAFFVLIAVLLAHLSWAALVGILVLMALALRLNLSRIDKKFDRAKRP